MKHAAGSPAAVAVVRAFVVLQKRIAQERQRDGWIEEVRGPKKPKGRLSGLESVRRGNRQVPGT